MKTLEDMFVHMLKDVYHAEKQILRALPKMAKQAENEDLKAAMETHRNETETQVQRLEQVFEIMERKPRAEVCEAIQGLLEEAKDVMDEAEDPQVKDAGLIAAAQAVEHYEIARYGTMKAWAQQLGMDDVAQLLDETLEEEKRTDQILTELAEAQVNAAADEDEEAKA